MDDSVIEGIMNELPQWTSLAIHVDVITIDIGFHIGDAFYFGPENDITPEQLRNLREPIYQPRVPIYRNLVLTSSLEHDHAELRKYYADVLRLMDKYTKDPAQQESYFWLQPAIFAPGELQITFPWFDTWPESEFILERLGTENVGLIFSGVEQGWKLDIFAVTDRLYFRDRCPDSDEERCCITCTKHVLLPQIPKVQTRMRNILDDLRSTFGHDYWTNDYPRWTSANY